MDRGRSSTRGAHTAPPPASSVNAQSQTHKHTESEHAQEERHPVGESKGSSGAPPQIDPVMVMDMFTAILSQMDGIETSLERQSANDNPQVPTPAASV